MMDAMPMRLSSLSLFNRVCWLTALCLLTVSAVAAQSTTSTQESFLAYRCEFDAATNQAMIYASLVDVNGQRLPRTSYEVALSTPTMDAVPLQRITVTDQTSRPPLEMVIVLDTTNTMPILEVVTAVSTQLMPRLDVNDQVAFIAADAQITATTPFYIDKNRLINEHMLDLVTHEGDNRVYDGVAQAINDLGPLENTRQTILFITDSSQREGIQQANASEIGASASANKTQIYPIGIHLWDDPNDTDLVSMATSSRGYAWIYDEETRSNAAAGSAVGDRLNRLVETLDSEVLISVDMRDQVPDANNQVLFDIVIRLENGVTLSDEIACPLGQLNHSIAFEEGTPLNVTTSEPVNLTVVPLTQLSPEQTSIVFRVNDQIVQSGDSTVFTFNTPSNDPGEYIISAQLRDLNDNTLATTEETVRINSQQNIQLVVSEGSLPDLTPLTLAARADENTTLSEVRFEIRRRSDPELSYPLAAGRASFVNGVASLELSDLRAEVKRLFPDVEDGETFDIQAIVPGLNDVVLAESEPLGFQYRVAPANNGQVNNEPTRELNAVESFFASVTRDAIISATLALALFILNVILFFRVGRARVRRMIYTPDNTEMSNRLMAVTVRRDNLKQTISLTKRTVTLGRGSGNDVNLGDDTNISREHAVIMWRRKRWYYTHRKPRLRTRIDGRRIVGYVLVELEAVTEMDMGETKVFFHSASQQDVSELTKTNL